MKKKSKKLDSHFDSQELFHFLNYLITLQRKEGKLTEGDVFYMISLKWFNNFKKRSVPEEKKDKL